MNKTCNKCGANKPLNERFFRADAKCKSGFRSVCKDGEFYEDGVNKGTAPTSVIFNLSYCMAKLEAEDGKVYHYLYHDKTELK